MPTEKRKPALAALLSFFLPGIGQIYSGHVARGIAFQVTPFALLAVAVSMGLGVRSAGGFVLILLAVWVTSIAEAWFRRPRRYRPVSMRLVAAFAVVAFLLVPAFAVCSRAYYVEAFKVPAGSMIPTVRVGDHFFVDKASYRTRPPARGEVVVFPFPERPTENFVKRIIGAPGDRVELVDGHPVLNGWKVPSCEAGPFRYVDEGSGESHQGRLFVEFLDDAAYVTFYDASHPAPAAGVPFTVAAGSYFVLGDNRNNSFDSRFWNNGAGGAVPGATLKGPAAVKWLAEMSLVWRPIGNVPEAPSPESAAAVAACVASRPPREKTTPPPSSPR